MVIFVDFLILFNHLQTISPSQRSKTNNLMLFNVWQINVIPTEQTIVETKKYKKIFISISIF